MSPDPGRNLTERRPERKRSTPPRRVTFRGIAGGAKRRQFAVPFSIH